MFLDFYNLREQPFGVTPDPQFLYLGQTHREALASLLYGIETGRGFLALIAQPGMGKTTLLFHLMERLRETATTAFLFQTQCNSREFLRYLLTDLGLDADGQDLVDMHQRLNEALIRLARAGRRVVLIIDEAQNLESSVLETVRLLSDFETANSKLVQIILAGQPQLAAKLARPSLAQLQQRIAILSRLEPFNPSETERYIAHRLQTAGHQGQGIFRREALAMIAARSRGVPRNINHICFNSLSLGFALRKRRIGPEIIAEAVADLDMASVLRQADEPTTVASPGSLAAPVRSQPQLAGVPERHGAFHVVAMAALLAGAAYLWSPIIRVGIWTGLTQPTHTTATIAASSVQSGQPAFAAVAARPDGSEKGRKIRSDPNPSKSSRVAAGATIIQVARQQTLGEISRDRLGRFDRKTLKEIRELNPQLTDPNHILVGQRLLLPSRVPDSTGSRSSNEEPTVLERQR